MGLYAWHPVFMMAGTPSSSTPIRLGLASMSDKTPPRNSLSYRDAGVDIDAGDALVRDIGPEAARTRRAGADVALGGFGGLFDLKAAGFTDPILVAATDGVGTKLELARAVQRRLRDADGIDVPILSYNRSSKVTPFGVVR